MKNGPENKTRKIQIEDKNEMVCHGCFKSLSVKGPRFNDKAIGMETRDVLFKRLRLN